jgi:hypothetical protein
MREYGSVQTQFWSDLALQNLSTHAKLLAVYLLTGPHTNMLGCFRLPTGYVAEDLKWNEETVYNAFSELDQIRFLIRDPESNWILIINFLDWNPIENPNQGKSIVKLFKRVPHQSTVSKAIIKILLDQTKYLDEGFKNHLATLSQPFQNQEQNQEQEQEKDQEQDVVGKPSINDGLPSNSKIPLSINKKSIHDEETIGIPLQNNDVFITGKMDIHTWKKTYPNIDILQELRQIQAWNEANPSARKTRSQILRHINAWLAKEQRDSLQRQQAPPDHDVTRLATRGLSPTLAHNLVVGEQWLNHSKN